MKLLEEFKKQLGKLGKPKRIWLTSFNLSIEFIETHLLPVVLGVDVPKNRMDYEALQKELSDQKIDFRVYYDKRMMGSSDCKRTAIDIYGVSPRLIGFSEESIFHPKVIYLESHNGNAILGSGSANLTVSGWGRNQEVFAFRPVSTAEQSNQVHRFFKPLLVSTGHTKKLFLGKEYWGEDATWSFVHSFEKASFLDQLFFDEKDNRLAVWSPYFPRNLPAFIKQLQKVTDKPDLTVAIVPDRVEGKYIRTSWHDEIQSMLDDGQISFYESPVSKHENTDLRHAKIWKTSQNLAIGSWNFTGAGSNSAVKKNLNNIEAGFVFRNSSSVEESLGKELLITREDFAGTDLLEDESLKLTFPKELPFEIRVYFDWNEQIYWFEGKWIDNGSKANYQLKLPDYKEFDVTGRRKNAAINIPPIYLRASPKELLNQHSFEVLEQGNVVYSGLIIESSTQDRRIQEYESIIDLLDGWVSGEDPESGENTHLCSELNRSGELPDMDAALGGDSVLVEVNATKPTTSYFRLFQATGAYEKRISEVKQIEQLEKLVFVYPGCLKEFRDKIDQKITDSDIGKEGVFNWFLAQEINKLVRVAREQYTSVRSKGSPTTPPEHKWSTLELTIPILPKELSNRKRYLNLIKRECKYANN